MAKAEKSRCSGSLHGYGLQRLTYAGAREIFSQVPAQGGLAEKGIASTVCGTTFASELLNAGCALSVCRNFLGAYQR